MKYFVVSDIHSFYTPLITALTKAGFDKNNPNHTLVSCGDAFDRGEESKEVFRFLMTLERKVLIKGNHDLLLEELCMREFAHSYDNHNGTKKTVVDIGGGGYAKPFAECCANTWNKTARYRELLVNYFETENYIFVHSWIPTNIVREENASKPWHQKGKTHSYREDWRDANDLEWEEAMWTNPFERYADGLNQTGKTIVFGHWHCSAGHKMLGWCEDEFENALWEPCYADGIIGIDRCTAHTGEVNVLVIED